MRRLARAEQAGSDQVGSEAWIPLASGTGHAGLACRLPLRRDAGQLARIKDVATIEGIRDNQLVGYGLVVGLRGTGDSSQTVFPAQTLISALERMGITVPQTGSQQRQQHAGEEHGRRSLSWPRCRPSAGPATRWTSPSPRPAMRARSKAAFC